MGVLGVDEPHKEQVVIIDEDLGLRATADAAVKISKPIFHPSLGALASPRSRTVGRGAVQSSTNRCEQMKIRAGTAPARCNYSGRGQFLWPVLKWVFLHGRSSGVPKARGAPGSARTEPSLLSMSSSQGRTDPSLVRVIGRTRHRARRSHTVQQLEHAEAGGDGGPLRHT